MSDVVMPRLTAVVRCGELAATLSRVRAAVGRTMEERVDLAMALADADASLSALADAERAAVQWPAQTLLVPGRLSAETWEAIGECTVIGGRS